MHECSYWSLTSASMDPHANNEGENKIKISSNDDIYYTYSVYMFNLSRKRLNMARLMFSISNLTRFKEVVGSKLVFKARTNCNSCS